jgi:hypothetical protein
MSEQPRCDRVAVAIEMADQEAFDGQRQARHRRSGGTVGKPSCPSVSDAMTAAVASAQSRIRVAAASGDRSVVR